MEQKTKAQAEYENILEKIKDRMPRNYIKYVRQKLGENRKYISDFQIQNTKSGKTCNLKIARLLLEVAEEYGPKEN